MVKLKPSHFKIYIIFYKWNESKITYLVISVAINKQIYITDFLFSSASML